MFRRPGFAIAWAILILMVCLMPGSAVPRYGFLSDLPLDKLVHAILFGVFFVLLVKWARGQAAHLDLRQHAFLAGFAIAVIYGGIIELLQETMALGREGDLPDLLADVVGVILGMAYLRWGEAKLMHHRER